MNSTERTKRHMGVIHVVLSKEILRVGSLIFYPGPQASLVFNELRNSLSSASIHHTNVLWKQKEQPVPMLAVRNPPKTHGDVFPAMKPVGSSLNKITS